MGGGGGSKLCATICYLVQWTEEGRGQTPFSASEKFINFGTGGLPPLVEGDAKSVFSLIGLKLNCSSRSSWQELFLILTNQLITPVIANCETIVRLRQISSSGTLSDCALTLQISPELTFHFSLWLSCNFSHNLLPRSNLNNFLPSLEYCLEWDLIWIEFNLPSICHHIIEYKKEGGNSKYQLIRIHTKYHTIFSFLIACHMEEG